MECVGAEPGAFTDEALVLENAVGKEEDRRYEGLMVGTALGTSDGFTVGIMLGKSDGKPVGVMLGSSDGMPVGK